MALAPALRRLPALEQLSLLINPLGDEGLAALVAPPPPAGALPAPTRGLAQLEALDLGRTQVTDAGCAVLVAALDNGRLPALDKVDLDDMHASAAAQTAVREALARYIVRREALARYIVPYGLRMYTATGKAVR